MLNVSKISKVKSDNIMIHFRTLLSWASFTLLLPGTAFSQKTMPDSPSTLRVMSYNIRYDTPDDGRNAWSHRKEKVANLIRFYQADLIGLQEALYRQLTYLEGQLEGYGRIGVGRDDGKQQGEFSPILYAQDQLELLDNGTFWLSETPERPSVGWDASMERIATWGQFRYRSGGDTVFYFNTHFDHRGEKARQESAQLLRKKIDEYASNHPVIVTGDFNSDPASVPYQRMTHDGGLRDAKVVSETPPIGPDQSYSGFEVTDSLPGKRIDYVFVGPSVHVRRYATITSFSDGHFPSDHLPVVADMDW